MDEDGEENCWLWLWWWCWTAVDVAVWADRAALGNGHSWCDGGRLWNGIRCGRCGLEEEDEDEEEPAPPEALPEDDDIPELFADDEDRPDDGFLHLMQLQDSFCVGSVISHTEFELASTDDVDEDVVLSHASFGSDLIVTPSDDPVVVVPAAAWGTLGLIIQSCQARSGSRTAAEQLICTEDMLFWLPRSFEGDSGTVNGGFMRGLLLPLALLLLLLLLLLLPLLLVLLPPPPLLVVVGLLPVEDTRSAASELDTAAVREDAAAWQMADLEVEVEEVVLVPFEPLGGDQSSMSVTRTYLDG